MEKDGNDSKEKKKHRNRLSYTRHRKSILNRARERYHAKKVILFPSQASRKKMPPFAFNRPKKRRPLIGWGVGHPLKLIRLVEQILILVVIVVSTYFLLRETVGFLIQTEGSPSTAWLKAFIVEALILTLSWLRAPDWRKKVVKGALLLALFGYTTWTVVGGVWTQGQMKVLEASLSEKRALEIQESITQKESMRDRYIEQGADILARRYDRQIDALRDQLSDVRSHMLKNPGAQTVLINFSALAFFRLIVILANSFLVAHFSAFFSQRSAPALRFVGD